MSIQEYMQNTFSTNVQNLTENICQQNVGQTQEVTISIGGTVDAVNIKQDAQATAMASCVTDNYLKLLEQSEQFNQAANTLDQSESSKQKGLTLALVGALVAFALLLLIIYFVVKRGAKKSAQNVASQAATNATAQATRATSNAVSKASQQALQQLSSAGQQALASASSSLTGAVTSSLSGSGMGTATG
jgi:hypothetical protein